MSSDEAPFDADTCVEIDRIVVFGDSMSSADGTRQLTNGEWPPANFYQTGRFSGGTINYVDVLASYLGAFDVQNFALGSATTDSRIVPSSTGLGRYVVPGVYQQISNEINSLSADIDLAIMWAGGNDFFFTGNTDQGPLAAQRQARNIAILVESGKVKNVIALNLPELYLLPGISSTDVESTKAFVEGFNHQYMRDVQALRNQFPNVNIMSVDISNLIRFIVSYRESLNLVTLAGSCIRMYHAPLSNEVCTNLDSYIFYDEYHFNESSNMILAKLLLEMLSQNIRPCLTAHGN